VRDLVERAPVSRAVVRRFIPGAHEADVVRATGELQSVGKLVTIDYLGEDTRYPEQAQHTRDAYLGLLRALSHEGYSLGGRAEVSVKLTALGHAPARRSRRSPSTTPARSAQAALNAGTTVTVDMEDHTTTDAIAHASSSAAP
jgi:proline dehydrogenase